MEMVELQKNAILVIQGEEPEIERVFYSQIMRDCVYYFRCGRNLTYHGEVITTRERFIEICKKEKWSELLKESTAKE